MSYRVVNFCEIPDASYEKLSELILSAFQERIEAGINFDCCSFTPDVLKKYLEDKTTFVVLDDNGNYVATRSCQFKRDKRGRPIGRMYYLAVAVSARRQGLSRLLLKFCAEKMREQGAVCLVTSTAVNAESSVKSHLKEGFRIVGYKHLKGKNYFSYMFEYDLLNKQMSLLERVIEKVRFYKSFVETRFLYRKDGRYTFGGKLINRK